MNIPAIRIDNLPADRKEARRREIGYPINEARAAERGMAVRRILILPPKSLSTGWPDQTKDHVILFCSNGLAGLRTCAS